MQDLAADPIDPAGRFFDPTADGQGGELGLVGKQAGGDLRFQAAPAGEAFSRNPSLAAVGRRQASNPASDPGGGAW
jgi:hypothetical protein